jgi:hypothetical protein
MQVINNAVQLLMQGGTFPLKEFDDWEAVMPKRYHTLKTLIAAAYTRCILAQQLRNTVAGQQGYVPPFHNMDNVFAKEDDTDTTDTTKTNIPALTMGSTIMGVQTGTIHDSVANAINQLSANQTVLMNQIAVLSYTNVPPPPAPYNTNHQSNNSPSQCSSTDFV